MREAYYSLKASREVGSREQHVISFERSRVWEGKAGDSRPLGKAPTFLDGLRAHARAMRRMFTPVKTRSRVYRDL